MKKFFSDKTVKTVAVLLAALLLLVLVYAVFFRKAEKTSGYEPTPQEERLSQILSKIEGVEEATAMIVEEDGKPVSAVVVFRGADSILTRMRVIDATSGALNLNKQNISVYPAS